MVNGMEIGNQNRHVLMILLIAFLAFMSSMTSVAIAQETSYSIAETQITTNGKAILPEIYADKIAYIVYHDNGYLGDIYIHDLTTQDKIPVYTGTITRASLDMYGPRTVWSSDNTEGYDIYMYDLSIYDLSKSKLTKITNDGKSCYPRIHGNKIVYLSGNPYSDIFIYDISTGQEPTQITTGATAILPDIYDDKIVWCENYNLYMYDISTGQEPTQITYNDKAVGAHIYEDKIAWSDSENKIHIYDISTSVDVTIASTNYSNVPNIFEDKVVWSDYHDSHSNDDIFMYNITTFEKTQITTNGHSRDPNIFRNRIVYRNYGGTVGFGTDVYMATLSIITPSVIPLPRRTVGSHNEKFDIVFVPDEDYGSSANIDTWLPTFLENINDQIDERLGGTAPVSGNLEKFNFYYTTTQGDAEPDVKMTLPAGLTKTSTFADAYVIFHQREFGDACMGGTPTIYSAEGPVGRSFIHESGHGVFGLADEYDDDNCRTSYFQPDPMPNIWATEAIGREDATEQNWNPDDIQKFTECQGDWWKLGTTEYIMFDGNYFANGWGKPAERRIQWFLNQYQPDSSTEPASSRGESSIWINLEISNGVFSLLDESFVAESAPNYLPGNYDFTAKVYSTSGTLLGEYRFNDPRIILAESDYEGPTWLDNTEFQLILPYFNNGGRVDLIESETGNVKLSIDISQYATPTTGVTPPVANANGPYIVNEGSPITFDASGSTDSDGDALQYRWDFDSDGVWDTILQSTPTATYTWYDDFSGNAKVEVSDGTTAATATASVTVNNVAPTVDAGADQTVNEGEVITFSGSYIDAGTADTHTFEWDFGDGFTASDTLTPTHAYTDNGVYTVTLTVTDDDGGVGTDTLVVTVNNVNPVLGTITLPIDPYKVNTPVSVSSTFTDASILDTHTAVWDWGYGTTKAGIVAEANGAGTVTGEHAYTKSGIYWATLTVTDDDGGSAIVTSDYYVVVYDPEGGFITGGGWITSPAGAYVPDTTLAGKATFGFVSKYQKGATVPTGNTEFQFKVAKLNFKSTSYDWLVIAGAQAKYKGTGTINGEGNYGFMLSAVDGAIKGDNIDKFRIKIWDKASGEIVYDNQIGASEDAEPTTAIGGGSIVVHKVK